jgi:hypothetical protein
MPATNEINQIGKREDFANLISVADAKKTPVTTMIPKGTKPTNTKFSWQADKYDSTSTDGVVDGADVSAYEDAAVNRKKLENHVQRFWKTPKVTTMAEEVSDIAGINSADAQGVRGGTEFARAKAKKAIELKRNIEATLLSDNEAQEDDGAVPYKTRGLGKFIQATAQSYLPVPAAYLTPAASIYTSTAAAFDEDDLRALLQSRWENVGMPTANLYAIVGSAIKNRITDFTRYMPTVANFSLSRTYNPADNRKVESIVEMYAGDYGSLEIMLDSFLPNNNRGYILDFDFLELRTHTMPRVKDLPDLGGGPRALIEAIVGLAVTNPLAHCKIAAS